MRRARHLVVAVILLALSFVASSAADEARNPSPAQDHPLPCIRRWEQSEAPDDYDHDLDGTYKTPYQFDEPTWDSNAKAGPHTDWVGRMSEAARTRPDIVDSQARVLRSRRGLQPWSAKVRRHCR